MGVPSDAEIAEAVDRILRTNDLQTITLRMVMNMLCDQFSLPKEHLNPQKPYVRTLINDFLAKHYQPAENEAASEGDGEAQVGNTQVSNTHGEQGGDGEDDEGDEGDEDRGTKRSAPGSMSGRKVGRPRGSTNGSGAGSGKTAPKVPKAVRLTGLEKPVVLAQPLADFFKEVVMPRSQIPKRISVYAKEHKLQDPNNGRRIVSDAALKEAFNVDEFTFFSLQKLISGLVYRPEECSEELQELAKQCEEKLLEEKRVKREQLVASGEIDAASAKRSSKKQKRVDANGEPRKTGLSKPMQLSAALTAVVGEDQLSRSDVMKKIWDYIKANNLKDPNNGKQVLCDDKLKAVFDGNNTIGNIAIMKYLSQHMSKIEET